MEYWPSFYVVIQMVSNHKAKNIQSIGFFCMDDLLNIPDKMNDLYHKYRL